VRKADQREAAEMLRRILDAVERGKLTANPPTEQVDSPLALDNDWT
jgi:hypothetical protein